MSTGQIFGTKDLGRAIQEARARRRLTQVELARHANVSRGVLQKLEGGHGTVSLENALKILNLLSLDLVVRPRASEPKPTDHGA